ncbi:MAG: hypothetical protein ACRD1J_08045, partial [Terriglobia bacterium]
LGGAYIAVIAMCAAFGDSPQIKFQGRASLYRIHDRLRHVCATRVRDYTGSVAAPEVVSGILSVDRILLPAAERTRI